MRTSLRLALVALVVALVVPACGDDTTTETTLPDSTTTTAVTTTTAATAAPTPGGDLQLLLDEYERTPLRVTYLFGDGSESTTLILSQDPTADPPVEAVILPEADSKLITIGDESIFCDTAANQCFSVPGGGGAGFSANLLGPFAGGLFLAADLETVPGAEVTTETAEVAGRASLCFTFEPPANAGFDTDLVRQCLDAELGFTLIVEAREAGSNTLETIMELIDFGEPLEDDFTPTGPVADSP
jgi:hypothetical protein